MQPGIEATACVCELICLYVYVYDLSNGFVSNDLEWLVTYRFQVYGVTIDALNVLYAQLTRDLFAITEFLLQVQLQHSGMECAQLCQKLHWKHDTAKFSRRGPETKTMVR